MRTVDHCHSLNLVLRLTPRQRPICWLLVPGLLLGLLLASGGCGGDADPAPQAAHDSPPAKQVASAVEGEDPAAVEQPAETNSETSDTDPIQPVGPGDSDAALRENPTAQPRGFLDGKGRLTAPRAVDERRVAAAGLRRIAGKHVTVYTDLPESDAVDALPGLFDQAVGQWCAYFGVDRAAVADWRTHGFVMQNRARFERAGLIPPEIPDFLNGFSAGGDFWLYDQTSPYYRRHLFLHEGTHAFMNNLIGGAGPPWYVEGIAELLATHTLEAGRLTLNTFPQDRRAVPGLGRIEMVQTAVAEDRAMELANVLAFSGRAHLQNEPYGWCWALAALLDGHPRYRARFRALPSNLRQPDFTRQFMKSVESDWRELNEAWQLFVTTLDYGHDISRTAIDFTPGSNQVDGERGMTVDAARGWQNTGLRLEAGKTYELSATGRYTVATEPEPWWSEPGGVTLRYHAGRPLGRLLAAVRPDDGGDRLSAFLSPEEIGLAATISPSASGTLFLAINDSPGELAENSGTLNVTIAEK